MYANDELMKEITPKCIVLLKVMFYLWFTVVICGADTFRRSRVAPVAAVSCTELGF